MVGLIRALEGGRADPAPPKPIFPRYLKNGGAECSRFWHTLEFNNIFVQILTSQIQRPGHQVRSKS